MHFESDRNSHSPLELIALRDLNKSQQKNLKSINETVFINHNISIKIDQYNAKTLPKFVESIVFYQK